MPCIQEDSANLAQDVLDKLTDSIASLASVYHRLPESFAVYTHTDFDHEEETVEN